MKIIDPGHKYLVDSYDGGKPLEITFMKREGVGYPGNKGHHSGTNIQELMRIVIHRTGYLNNQGKHINNLIAIKKMGEILWLFEDRAAIRHGFKSEDIDFRPENIEKESYCLTCGHILCKGH